MTLLQQAKAFLKAHRTRPKKQLGQHFLINPDVLSIIIEAGGVTDTDVVIEIGAGLGCLTAALADCAKSVIAIEVDPLLYAELESQFSTDTDVQIVHADVLKIEFSSLLPPNTHPKVIANLPYGITTPILSKLLEHTDQLSSCVLMMQREVAERIVASPGGKDYGALTIGVSYYADTTLIGILPPQNFFPAPQVDSALLKLTMREKPKVVANDEDYFFRVVREAFRGRRKMLKNSLRRFASAEKLNEAFAELNIAPQRRAETLDITEFAALANLLQTNV
jgi:16S rRNA (adenine1518-N6/adenine1519-N6)-dimethyltransferase